MIFTVLLVLFITIPILEIALLLNVKEFIGFRGTLALVVATALLGAWLARWQGLRQTQPPQHGRGGGDQYH